MIAYFFILYNLAASQLSNLSQQQALIGTILELLQDYEIIIIGDREFGSVKLACRAG